MHSANHLRLLLDNQAVRIAQSVDHAVHDDPDLVVAGQNAAPDEEMMKEVALGVH